LHGGAAHIAFGTGDGLGLRDFKTFAAQYPTPHNCCVRFVVAVAGRPRNTRYRAGASPYPDRTLTGWIRSAYPDAPPDSGQSLGWTGKLLDSLNSGPDGRFWTRSPFLGGENGEKCVLAGDSDGTEP
jgi:hypothetical protein